MKTKIILTILSLCGAFCLNAQVLFNEVYTDPGGNKHEFFELYNTNTSAAPESLDNYTLVTFFEFTGGNGDIGFYVVDLPNVSIAPRGYFVGSAALPFSYQGNTNSIASDFSWNSAGFTSGSTGGNIKKWVYGHDNLSDGNPDYDEESLPANFNDLFYRRVGQGASYTMFLYKNGVLVNGVIFGTGGFTEVIPIIIGLPKLYINMSGSSPDFEIDFSIYNTTAVRIEDVTEEAGSDNGYMREADGKCGGWLKSSSQAEHTPQRTNGAVDINDGVISVSSIITRGNVINGSVVKYDVVSAPASTFPVTLEVYTDLGSDTTILDGTDVYVESNTENVVSDGPFTTTFHPNSANILIVVKSNVGCIDKIAFIPNVSVLPVKLISFSGNNNGHKTKLDWTLAANEQAYKIVVEKSLDGRNFESSYTTEATAKPGIETYQYSANEITGKTFYRLRITEKSGVVTYSKTLVFNNTAETNTGLNIIGNQITDKLVIGFQSVTDQQADINILDMSGKIVSRQRIKAMKGNNTTSINLPASLTNGMYIAALTTSNNNSTAKFIKQ